MRIKGLLLSNLFSVSVFEVKMLFHRAPTLVSKRHIIGTTIWLRNMAYFEGGKLADGTIFRRPLPAPAIELSSAKGTQLFSEALQNGTAKCFFRLMEQLHTQNEPEYCGLATLVTVLNALNIDPHRRWKGNWRFYSEELLDCCEPLHKVKKSGIDFDKLASLARCNGLHVEAVRAQDTSVDDFRQMVLAASQSETFTLALAYSRKILNQTGSGHYSPMGAYHAPSDHLLILDCARFKYRPHWVPLPMMFDAMLALDPDTSKTRGFMKMAPVEQYGPPPAAHLLNLKIRPQHDLNVKDIHFHMKQIAANVQTPEEFLTGAATLLETSFEIEFKGHGCSSPYRKSRIFEQLKLIKPWGDESRYAPDHVNKRKALVLSLDHSYVAQLLHNRPKLQEEIIERLKLPEDAGELAVELSYVRPYVQKVVESARADVDNQLAQGTPENLIASTISRAASVSPVPSMKTSHETPFPPGTVRPGPSVRPLEIQQVQRG